MKRARLLRLKVIVVAGLAAIPCSLFALDPVKSVFQFNCHTWTRQNGLPVNGINAIAQSEDGHVWLGTSKGLVRFDGTEFRLFGITNYSQFRNQVVSSLSPSVQGGMWFGVYHACFGYSDNGNLTMAEAPWVRRNMNVNAVRELRDASVWVASEIGAGRWQRNRPEASFFDETLRQASAICEDASGTVWVGTYGQGLHFWKDGAFRSVSDPSLTNVPINAMAIDGHGQLWLGTDSGLWCYGADGRRREVPELVNEVRALLVDSRGTLWIGTSGAGLATVRDGKYVFFQKSHGLAQDNVTALFQDAEGSLWIGTQDGLSQLTDLKLPMISATEGLAHTSAHAVSTARNGGVWISTSEGISRYHDGRVRNYTLEDGLAVAYVKRVLEASNGEVYLINGRMGIEVLADDNVVARYTHSVWPVALVETPAGVVVSVGNQLFDINRTAMTPFQYKDGKAPDLQWVYNLCVGRDGAIWAATVNGIFKVSRDGTWKHWSTAEGLSSYKVNYITEDTDGTVWAGLATGIARLRGDEIRNISRQNGLVDDFIYAIVPDLQGDFWVDSVGGIFRVNRTSLNACADGKTDRVNCTAFDGMEAVKTIDKTDQEASGCRSADGKIWFPSPQGAIMVDPTNIFINRVAPPVHITRIRVNGLERPRSQALASEPGGGNLEVHYKAISFNAGQKLQFRYRLAGHEKEWIAAGDRRSAIYANLRPGKYRFEVQACNADGIWSATGDSFELELPPRFYQTAWFRWLAGLVATAILAGAYAWRVQHLTRRQRTLQQTNEQLETRVRERTQELAEQRNLLRTLIDHLPDSFFVKDRESRVIIDNLAHARMLGFQGPEQAVGTTDFERFPKELADKFRADEVRVMERGEHFNGEEVLVNLSTGMLRWFQTTKVPLRDQQGAIVGIAGINRDITERREAEEALRQKTALFEALVNSSIDGILVVSKEGRRILQNQQTIRLWKIPPALLETGNHAGQIEHMISMVRFPEQFREKLDHLYGHPAETSRDEVQLKDGTVLDRFTAPILGDDGTCYGRIWMFRDITERKQMVLEMERTHKELLLASRHAGMAEVATSVLHNVGNVLNSVNVSASVLEDRVLHSPIGNLLKVVELLRRHEPDLGTFLAGNNKGRQLIRYLETLVNHLSNERSELIEEAKSLARNVEHIKEIVVMQQGYAHAAGIAETVNTSELVEDALRMHALAYERHEVRLVRDFAQDARISVDRHKVIQILVNLLQNAKYACDSNPPGNRTVIVRIRKPDPARVCVVVEDNGVGIPRENLTRIFSHGFTTWKNGHGFGLHSGALAAKEMGGSLTAHSEGTGKGATFTLELPVQYQGGFALEEISDPPLNAWAE